MQLGLSLVFITGCDSQNETIQNQIESQLDQVSRIPATIAGQSPFQNSKVILDLETMVDEGIQLKESNPGKNLQTSSSLLLARNDGDVVIPQGTALVAVIDNNCVASALSEGNDDIFSAKIASSQDVAAKLERQAYSIKTSEDMLLGDLQNQANSDGCLIGLSNEMTLSASATFDDPAIDQQNQISSVRALESYDLFYSPQFGITEEVVIAIVDTGVLYTHPDLAEVMWDDGMGNKGYDFVNDDNDPIDDQGHGTHVAGLAAAHSNNGVGILGIMPVGAEIMGVKVLGADGSGTITGIVNGINYAVAQGADVINMSLGGPGASAALQDAVTNAVNAGVVVVVAAGNDGQELTDTNIVSPASYGRDLDGMITIGSADAVSKNRSGFSNFSTTYVELVAPGSNGIISTYLDNGYADLQGTSMASPVSAGAAALVVGLLKSNEITYTPARIEGIVHNSALSRTGLASQFKNGKHLDLLSLSQALGSLVLDSDGGIGRSAE